MYIASDVIGYSLEEALFLLEKEGFYVIVKESLGKKLIEHGETRVIKQGPVVKNHIEVIISYF
ncbi:MAG: PASTA domain-containing protein, partial [Clostridiales bacterium]|nr:PASTA domain-containing protein [Clostridiales bacterium]